MDVTRRRFLACAGAASANVNCRIFPGHSQEEIRKTLIGIFDDPKLTVEYMADDGTLSPTAPNRESQPPPPLRADVFGPLHQVTEEMWPGMLVIPSMSVGASDSIYTIMAGLPSYGIGGAAIGNCSGELRPSGFRTCVGTSWPSLNTTTEIMEPSGASVAILRMPSIHLR